MQGFFFICVRLAADGFETERYMIPTMLTGSRRLL